MLIAYTCRLTSGDGGVTQSRMEKVADSQSPQRSEQGGPARARSERGVGAPLRRKEDARFLSGRAVGFVAGGGGALGSAHLGVYKAFCEAGADFVVVGRQVGKGLGRAEKVGRGYLVSPADELQRVGRIDLVLRGKETALVDAGGPGANRLRVAEIDSALKRLDDDLARWTKEGGGAADSSFVAAKRAEREALAETPVLLRDRGWKME